MSYTENLHLQTLDNLFTNIILASVWILIGYLTMIAVYGKWPNKRELARKLAHIGAGPIILIAWIAEISRSLALGISVITTLAIIVNYRIRLISTIEDIDRQSYGTIGYSIAVTTLIWLSWPQESTAAVAGLMVMVFGDGFAGLLGSTYPSLSWKVWGQRKSVIGTVAMGLISGTVLITLSKINGIGPNYSVIFILSIISTVLEQLTVLGFDNLVIPLVIGFLWQAWIPIVDK